MALPTINARGDVFGASGLPASVDTALRARVRRTTSITLTTGVFSAAVTFESEDFDTSAFWDAGTPTVLTIPEDGYYCVIAHVVFAANSAGARTSVIAKNAVTGHQLITNPCATLATRHCLTKQDSFVAGDTTGVIMQQTSGGNLNVTSVTLAIYKLK